VRATNFGQKAGNLLAWASSGPKSRLGSDRLRCGTIDRRASSPRAPTLAVDPVACARVFDDRCRELAGHRSASDHAVDPHAAATMPTFQHYRTAFGCSGVIGLVRWPFSSSGGISRLKRDVWAANRRVLFATNGKPGLNRDAAQ
jgi:hypothetical protein